MVATELQKERSNAGLRANSPKILRIKLIRNELYWVGIFLLFCYLAYSFSILCFNKWPLSSCSTGDFTFPIFFIVFPLWSFGHAILLRLYEDEMEPMKLFYNCSVGLSISFLSLVLGTWITVIGWDCSSVYFQAAYLLCIIVSAGWLSIWILVFYQRFFLDVNANVSYLLILRCACIPSGVRRIGAIIPLLFFSFIFSIESNKHW